MSEISQEYCIPSSHPSLAGHFPKSPIVPGVVLLDYTSTLICHWKNRIRIKSLSQAKFHHPLYPEQLFTIHLTQSTEKSIKFECLKAEEKLLSGTFIIETTA
ncbi:MAG: hypothetical protein L3J75_06070 [Methylococcaceae bacterium]|nr:hypothetical protein [Methylococcaceae bacterium]